MRPITKFIAALTIILFVPCHLIGARLTGTAYDRETERPVAGAKVTVKGTAASAVSDSLGKFVFEDLPGGIYDLIADHADYQIGEIKRFRLGSTQNGTVDIFLKPLSSEERSKPRRPLIRTGRLVGKVVNSRTGESLPGATIRISELAIGGSSQPDGNYRIGEIKPGRYTVEALLIGYKQVKNYAVEVYSGEEAVLDFRLEETILPLGTEVIVYGEKPLLDPTKPAAIRSIEPREIERGTVRTLSEIVKELPGVVEIDRELHIRGGRTYETQYMIDGVPITDPLTRRGFGHSLNASAIRELNLYSGGADAEFSGATSGVVEIRTREGRENYGGSLVYRNDHFLGASGFDSDELEMALSGPERLTTALIGAVGLPGETYFFASGNFALSDTYLPYSRNLYSATLGGTSFAPRSDNHYSMLMKLSWKISPLVKIALAHSAAANINQDRSILETRLRTIDYSYGYPFEYQNILDNYNTFTQRSNQQTLILDYSLSVDKQLRLTAARFFTTLHSSVRGKYWRDYLEPVDDQPEIFEISPDSSYYIIDRGDGFWDSGDGDSWYDHYIENYSLKAGYETRPKLNWGVKMGLETEFQTVQVVDIYKPWLGASGFGLNYDAYRAKPAIFGAFLQNNLNLQGMVFDCGFRYDLWFPGKYAEDVLANDSISPIGQSLRDQFENGTEVVFGRRARGIFSPRFGISYLISPNLSLFGSYSRFARRAPPQYLYAKLYTPSESAYQLFGNPALDYEKTTNIEVGLKYLPTEKIAIGVSGYIKYIQDYIAATVVAPDPRFPNETYFMYFNLDYATSQGLEVEYIHKLSEVVELSANGAVSRARGERSLPGDILRGLRTRSEGEIYNEVAFDWDKPWQFLVKANINAPRDKALRVSGLPLGRDWNLNIKFWAQAGKRYTPYAGTTDDFGFLVYNPTGDINSKIGPWWNSLDASFQKYFHFSRYQLTIYLEGTNLLDHKNATLINPLTGKEYRDGDKIPKGGNILELPALTYKLPLWENPTRFLNPRQLKLGLGVSF